MVGAGALGAARSPAVAYQKDSAAAKLEQFGRQMEEQSANAVRFAVE